MRPRHRPTIAPALALVLITAAPSAAALTIVTTLCTDPLAPCFRVGLNTPGGNGVNRNEPTFITDAVSGVDGIGGSGAAFGRVGLGTLGAKATVVSAGPPRVNDAVVSRADVEFDDFFRFPGAIVQPSLLQFTFDLHGATSASGTMRNGGFVQVIADLNNETTSDVDSKGLEAAGTITLAVPIHQFDVVSLGLILITEADARDPGGATSDFLSTLGITQIALTDLNGHLRQDLTLTDFAGNILAPVTVPLPSALPLLAVGLAALRAVQRTSSQCPRLRRVGYRRVT